VVQQPPAAILVNQHEGRADDVAAIDAAVLGDRLDEPRLAGAECANQRHHGPLRQEIGQPGAEPGGVRFAVGKELKGLCHAGPRFQSN
jgi:hypothetical protein